MKCIVKQLFILLSLFVLGAPCTFSVNKAYKALSETGYFEKKDGFFKMIDKVAKGDTVLTNAATEAYFAENVDSKLDEIPVLYKGQTVWVRISELYPIKLAKGDTIFFDHHDAPEKRSVLERNFTPLMQSAMNLPVSRNFWLIMALIMAGVAAGLFALKIWPATKPYGNIILGAVAVALVGVSVAELMHMLANYNYVMNFIFPSQVGGWGNAILNFILLALVVTVQLVLINVIWQEPLNIDEYNDWLGKLGFAPVVLSGLFLVFLLVDSFSDEPMDGANYLYALGLLPVVGLIGAFFYFRQKRFLPGVFYPVCFILAGIGFAISVSLMSIFLILIAIAAIALALGLGFLWSFVTGLGSSRVTGKTADGRTVSGWKDWSGKVHGDDGNTYTID